jgi:hypothetical protein
MDLEMNSSTVTATATSISSTISTGAINGAIGAVEGVMSGGLVANILKLVLVLGGGILVGILVKKLKDWLNTQADKTTQIDKQEDQSSLAKQTQQVAQGADTAAGDIDQIRGQK